MKKTTIARKTLINSPQEKVWSILADFGNVQKVSPNIKSSCSIGDKKSGLGAERHCDFASMGAAVDERIVEWNEGESMRIEIYKTYKIPMMRNMEAHFSIEPSGNGTLLKATMTYNMSNFFGNIMNNLKMKSMNEKAWEQFLAGIKHHSETGETVGNDTELNLANVHVLS